MLNLAPGHIHECNAGVKKVNENECPRSHEVKGIIMVFMLKEIDLFYYLTDAGYFFIPMICIKKLFVA